ncbi:hypothetical protein M3Y96_01063600 [Aphelenchoides besseyi]|nr:hypothetical protein M3Y96_01063600 [Aphelenchoides besseyi]
MPGLQSVPNKPKQEKKVKNKDAQPPQEEPAKNENQKKRFRFWNRKPKPPKTARRNKLPSGFAEWEQVDQETYNLTSFYLRLWKAERWQCYPIQSRMAFFRYIPKAWFGKARSLHRAELEEWRKAASLFENLDPKASFDLDY